MKNNIFSKRSNKIKEYFFSSVAKEIEKVEKESGRKVLNFGPGNPDFPPFIGYIEKLEGFYKLPDTHLYPGYKGIDIFNQSLIAWYKKRFNVNLTSEEVMPLLGAKDGVSHIPFIFLDEGDEALIPDSGYPAFSPPVSYLGGKCIYYKITAHEGVAIDSNLEKLINKNTKYLWLNFPSNPTGIVANKIFLEKMVDIAQKNGIAIIYDNAYSEITYDGYVAPSIFQIKDAKDCAIEIGSFSKSHSFAGFRMGWAVGNKSIIKELLKFKSQMDSGLSLPLQHLASFALHNVNKKWTEEMINSYKTRRDTIAGYLRKIGLSFTLPKAGLYIWAKIPDSYKNCEVFVKEMLHTKQVFFVPGTVYGKVGKRYVRVSICVNIDNINLYLG